MYNTKCAVGLCVEAVKRSWNTVEYKVRGRSLSYETSTAINAGSLSLWWGFSFESQLLKNLEDLLR